MDKKLENQILKVVLNFIKWLKIYGEESYDHQSYYAGNYGKKAKRLYYDKQVLGTFVVSPMVLSEGIIPITRTLFWKKQRLPIADSHYAMGYLYLYQRYKNTVFYDTGKHFLKVLKSSRCYDYGNYCWGYPFDWVTRKGTIKKNTPLITTTPYAYEAYLQAYEIYDDNRWLEILHSIAEHVYRDLPQYQFSHNSCSTAYWPNDKIGGVINASAYRAFLLTSASKIFEEEKYEKSAFDNINFINNTQKNDGSWPYHANDNRDFVDNFHTCFILKNIVKIDNILGNGIFKETIKKGFQYYLDNLLDENGLPKPFSKPPRLIVYKRELYDYAECINILLLLRNEFRYANQILHNILNEILNKWVKNDGSFRTRKLFFGWDNVPMHRWAQSQMFRSLTFYLYSSIQ